MGFQQLAAIRQRQSSEIAFLANEKVEDEIVNTICSAAETLEQIEVRSSRFI